MRTKEKIEAEVDKAKYQNTYKKAKVNSYGLTKEPKQNRIKAWKCYRCDLTFKEASHALLHKDILGHSARQIDIIAA